MQTKRHTRSSRRGVLGGSLARDAVEVRHDRHASSTILRSVRLTNTPTLGTSGNPPVKERDAPTPAPSRRYAMRSFQLKRIKRHQPPTGLLCVLRVWGTRTRLAGGQVRLLRVCTRRLLRRDGSVARGRSHRQSTATASPRASSSRRSGPGLSRSQGLRIRRLQYAGRASGLILLVSRPRDSSRCRRGQLSTDAAERRPSDAQSDADSQTDALPTPARPATARTTVGPLGNPARADPQRGATTSPRV
jgi:hypothetical protein